MTKMMEQLLIEGYQSMAEINLSIASESYMLECEAYDCNENHLSANQDGE